MNIRVSLIGLCFALTDWSGNLFPCWWHSRRLEIKADRPSRPWRQRLLTGALDGVILHLLLLVLNSRHCEFLIEIRRFYQN
ncbi:hypothetical protein BT63DRAFT_293263 [Microthyrium microscopicum]|uniref:Uncharacterized protein n=1 Tax=Microthyrium microscopicum TaxID=703497 RepID=A0A6A6U758_9PEZI|nr:hypothetical protein BT63DRAFT_293263 [Microthyrium microscopicum]